MRLLFVIFKWTFYASLTVLAVTWFTKDHLPAGDSYDLDLLTQPVQRITSRPGFSLEADGLTYVVEPKYSYELYGVVVSYNDSDAFGDLWHKRVQDYVNIRDLCVMWGENVKLDMHKRMQFSNGSFTCNWSWSDHQTGGEFNNYEVSNNHILVEDLTVKRALMSADVGDHIRMKGSLVHYINTETSFTRRTSTTRNDTGNGACETVFVDEFEIIKKTNRGTRQLHDASRWLAGISFIGFLVLAFFAPVRFKH